ncbi:MAG: hypothetical protein LBC53_09915 [Spirochaetaceae bacterium]|nr:hypothetical protein [Spirochaetaceae bacterium]
MKKPAANFWWVWEALASQRGSGGGAPSRNQDASWRLAWPEAAAAGKRGFCEIRPTSGGAGAGKPWV